MRETLLRPVTIGAVCLVSLFGGLLIDLTTTQELVVAIIFNIPIALSGLTTSRQLTIWTVVLALSANVAAAYENALVFSGYDSITLLNRGLAALSFLIVGVMTLAREGAVDEVAELGQAQDSATRERTLRRFVTALSAPMNADELISRATSSLRALLAAEGVVVVTLRDDRFVEPRYADGNCSNLARTGEIASWQSTRSRSTTPPRSPCVPSGDC